ncbi:MAG: DUF4097 family beta strand repeat-containing protein [Acidobacteria bacterium]|nr:DUF4097 family beta strand repeat-containing protein [Acidobacteriota bacterium]
MKRRSIVGPLILILIGTVFLINNLRPELPLADMVAVYWPYLLIGWGVLRLAEVLWSFSRGDRVLPSMSGGEVVLVVLIALLGTGLFSAHRHGIRFGMRGLEMFGEPYDFSVSVQKTLPEAPARIVVENLRGNVKVTGGAAQEIRVTGRKSIRALSRPEAARADQRTPVEIVAQGGSWVIRTNQDRLDNSERISDDLEIAAPAQAMLEVHARSGDYDISDVAGVQIRAERGDVRLNRIAGNARVEVRRSDLVRAVDVTGNVDLQGRGSDVELVSIKGQASVNGAFSGTLDFRNIAKPLHFESQNTDLRVEAVPGQLSMDLGEFSGRDLTGPIRLITKSKDVRIHDFTQSLELETERGDIELTLARTPVPKIDARSRTGKIDLTLPARSAFQLQASTEHGDAINEFGPPIEKETDGRAAALKGSAGQGPAIRLTTERGTVSVRKAGQGMKQADLVPKPEASGPM